MLIFSNCRGHLHGALTVFLEGRLDGPGVAPGEPGIQVSEVSCQTKARKKKRRHEATAALSPMVRVPSICDLGDRRAGEFGVWMEVQVVD